MENVKNEPENQTIQGTRKFIRANGIFSYFFNNSRKKTNSDFWWSRLVVLRDTPSWLKNLSI